MQDNSGCQLPLMRHDLKDTSYQFMGNIEILSTKKKYKRLKVYQTKNGLKIIFTNK